MKFMVLYFIVSWLNFSYDFLMTVTLGYFVIFRNGTFSLWNPCPSTFLLLYVMSLISKKTLFLHQGCALFFSIENLMCF